VIPRDYITEWRAHAPWVEDFQVEQDLVISRALVAIFSHPALRKSPAFRGGTALYKLHLKPAARYSEDIDLVQVDPGPAGPISAAVAGRGFCCAARAKNPSVSAALGSGPVGIMAK
jgi:Nucleotidyl transferase AbiEii toxin, Type IV TA system